MKRTLPGPVGWKHRRQWLALLRLIFLYAVLCYGLLELGLGIRSVIEAQPLLPQTEPSPALTAYPTQRAGVNVSLEQYADRNRRLAALENLRAAGFGWVRQRFDWGQLEPAPGVYAWEVSDELVAAAAAAGLEMVVVLHGSPAWARDAADLPPTDNPAAPPGDYADFARFAGNFAARYRESLRFYQVWDEPNIAPNWGNRWVEPVAYSRLLAQAASAIRAADADAVILLAALAPTADRGHTAIDEAHFLRRLYAAGAAPHFDAVAVQPFGFGLPPTDPRSRVEVLNFQRLGLLRRVMLAAGDGETPIWAVRYGWNRATNPVWGTVTPETQRRYVAQAAALADGWPWLAGLGWAVERPDSPPDDALWGFALYTPDGQPTPLLATFAAINRQRTSPQPAPLWPLLSQPLLWAVALAWVIWRGWRAGETAGVGQWPARFARQPWLIRVLCWLLLAVVYYYAVWPPLIGLCWLAAALLIAADPRAGLLLAGLLLPFHFQHKELALVGITLAVPPAHALILCSLPSLLRGARRRVFAPGLALPDWLALGWLAVGLLSAGANWSWAYSPGALWSTVLAPLLVYLLARALVQNRRGLGRVTAAVAIGGLAAAAIGLFLWVQGQGVAADGVRRLLGLTFSPNQTALMLERVLFVCLGLAAAVRSGRRTLWLAGAGIVALALLLTGSRGALLLGIPAGGLAWLALQPAIRRRLLRRAWLVAAAGVGALAAVLLLLGERLLNSGTVAQRLHIWQGALDLWAALPWLGVGPGGFFWRYPAFIPPQALHEPNLLHPHNLWLEMATGGGILGLLWLGGLLYWLLRRGMGEGDDLRPLEVGLLAALVAGLAHGQVDAFMALPELAAWNWLAIGLLGRREN